MTDLDSVLKSRDITLPALYSQGCGLPSGHSCTVVRVGP